MVGFHFAPQNTHRATAPAGSGFPTAMAGSEPNKTLPGASRFYARNGDVFMTSAWGGFYLTPHETARMLDLWRSPEPDEITAAVRNEMADELEAAMAEALRQTERKIAA